MSEVDEEIQPGQPMEEVQGPPEGEPSNQITLESVTSATDTCPSCGYNVTEPPGPDCLIKSLHGVIERICTIDDVIP